MNENTQKALKCLENGNYSGYFEKMDNVHKTPSQKTKYANLKSIFISSNYPHNFHDILYAFAKEISNPSVESDSIDYQEKYFETKALLLEARAEILSLREELLNLKSQK